MIKLSEKTLKYQRELLRQAMSTLGDVKIDEPMKRDDFTHLVSAIMQLEEARDIALTTNEQVAVSQFSFFCGAS